MNQSTEQQSEPQKPISHPSKDFGWAFTFFAWGVLFYFFPQYAKIPEGWDLFLKIPGFFWFLLGSVGLTVGFSKLGKDYSGQVVGVVLFGIAAYLLHYFAGILKVTWLALVFRIVALLFVLLATGFLFPMIAEFFVRPRREVIVREQSSQGITENIPHVSMFEFVIRIIIAVISFAAAILSLIKGFISS